MESVTNKRAGRPLRGSQKRVRTSFTLNPRHLIWLQNEASLRKINKSELLDLVIDEFQNEAAKTTRKPGISIPYKLIEQFCKKHHISKFMLFGSVLTNSFNNNSDIDVLVEFESGCKPSLFEMVKMQGDLSKLFDGRTIDLKTIPELSVYFRQNIINEAHTVYAH